MSVPLLTDEVMPICRISNELCFELFVFEDWKDQNGLKCDTVFLKGGEEVKIDGKQNLLHFMFALTFLSSKMFMW